MSINRFILQICKHSLKIVSALICLYLFKANDAYAQEGEYVLNEDKKVAIFINNGYYAIDVDNSFDDVLTYDRVSFGKYEWNGDTIRLKDVLLNFTMEMRVLNSRDLVLTKGFHSWMGKTFKYDHDLPLWDWTKTIEDYDRTQKTSVFIGDPIQHLYVIQVGMYGRISADMGRISN